MGRGRGGALTGRLGPPAECKVQDMWPTGMYMGDRKGAVKAPLMYVLMIIKLASLIGEPPELVHKVGRADR